MYNGDNVYSCFYDLASAFDTVEFCVLLENLFHAGIRGKCWRLLRAWYHRLRDPCSLEDCGYTVTEDDFKDLSDD